MSHPLNRLLHTIERSASRSSGHKRAYARLRRERAGRAAMISEPADVELFASTQPELFRMLDRRLSSLERCCEELDAALAHVGFAHPRSPAALGLARAERTLRSLADKIARRHTGLIENA
jgi:hypothetical protein